MMECCNLCYEEIQRGGCTCDCSRSKNKIYCSPHCMEVDFDQHDLLCKHFKHGNPLEDIDSSDFDDLVIFLSTEAGGWTDQKEEENEENQGLEGTAGVSGGEVPENLTGQRSEFLAAMNLLKSTDFMATASQLYSGEVITSLLGLPPSWTTAEGDCREMFLFRFADQAGHDGQHDTYFVQTIDGEALVKVTTDARFRMFPVGIWMPDMLQTALSDPPEIKGGDFIALKAARWRIEIVGEKRASPELKLVVDAVDDAFWIPGTRVGCSMATGNSMCC